MPFGMVQLSPDTRLTGWDGCSGYHYSDDIIYGFSHTHLSGTGISDYGDILLMPTVGDAYLTAKSSEPTGETTNGYASRFNHRDEIAQPGYYSVRLEDDNVFAELTTTKRVGVHRYTYPSTDEANIIIDLVHRDKVIESKLEITGNRTVVGSRRSEAWARNQIVYFAIEFSQPFTSSGIAVKDRIVPELKEVSSPNLKGFFRFDARGGKPVLAKVALSAVSVAGARANLVAETNDWDFEKVRRAASDAWNHELNKITVKGRKRGSASELSTPLFITR